MYKYKINIAKASSERCWICRVIQESTRRRRIMTRALQYLVMKTKRLLQLGVFLILLIVSGRRAVTGISRSCRRLSKNTGCWEKVWNTYSEARVSRSTFNHLLTQIRHKLERQTINEDPLSPELRLAICLYRLGRGTCFYTIAEMTGIGVSTVCTITRKVAQTIVDCLWEDAVTKYMLKSREDFKEKILDMDQMWQFPCCRTAVDGSHISMKCPAGEKIACKEYHNFKNFYSIVLMGMVE